MCIFLNKHITFVTYNTQTEWFKWRLRGAMTAWARAITKWKKMLLMVLNDEVSREEA